MKSGGKSIDFIHQEPQKHFSRADDYTWIDSVFHCILNKNHLLLKGDKMNLNVSLTNNSRLLDHDIWEGLCIQNLMETI